MPTVVNHMLTAISHMPTVVSHMPTVVSHMPIAVSHMPTAVSHMPTAVSHMPTAVSHMPTVVSHMPTAVSHMPTAVSHMPTVVSHILPFQCTPDPRNCVVYMKRWQSNRGLGTRLCQHGVCGILLHGAYSKRQQLQLPCQTLSHSQSRFEATTRSEDNIPEILLLFTFMLRNPTHYSSVL